MMPGREPIDVPTARYLYDQLGNWRLVAEWMRRKSGQRFSTDAIIQAVRIADRSGRHDAPKIARFAGAEQ